MNNNTAKSDHRSLIKLPMRNMGNKVSFPQHTGLANKMLRSDTSQTIRSRSAIFPLQLQLSKHLKVM